MSNFYRRKKWKQVRDKVWVIDNKKCQECKAAGRDTDAVLVHHVLTRTQYPEHAYSICVNGKRQLISLCQKCHTNIHRPEQIARSLAARKKAEDLQKK